MYNESTDYGTQIGPLPEILRVYFGKPGQTNKSEGGGGPGLNPGPTRYKADVLSITL